MSIERFSIYGDGAFLVSYTDESDGKNVATCLFLKTSLMPSALILWNGLRRDRSEENWASCFSLGEP